jgi:hypothetical protein
MLHEGSSGELSLTSLTARAARPDSRNGQTSAAVIVGFFLGAEVIHVQRYLFGVVRSA